MTVDTLDCIIKMEVERFSAQKKTTVSPAPAVADKGLQSLCPPEVTPATLDCHISQGLRADPYRMKQQWLAGTLPDPRIDECDKIPGTGSQPLLRNQVELPPLPAVPDPPPREGLRVMCMILTYSKRHDNNLQSVRATWGRRCHGFVAFSNLTDPEIPSIHTPVYGGERYQNTWQKMRALWKYTWYHYGNEFDWFLKADDDTYIVWENFMDMLQSDQMEDARKSGQGVYLGRRFGFNGEKKDNYTSGGAGYVLDRAALEKLAKKLDSKQCDPDGQHNFEDLFAGRCLRAAGVIPMDTRDGDLRERFHPLRPFHMTEFAFGKGLWYERYSLDPIQLGLKCCSRKSVSFHYQNHEEMLKIHRYLYKCRDGRLTSV